MTTIRRVLVVAVASLIFAASVTMARGEKGSITLALAGGRLIDGYGEPPLENAVILLAGNRIAAVGQEDSVSIPSGLPVIDTNGITMLPGLWESHGHLFHVGEANPVEFQTHFADQLDAIMASVAKVSVESAPR